MRRPLFPLSTVLFPGMPLPLHIFEPRYQEMIAYCLRTKEPFVVSLIREGQEALGPAAEPHAVGCTALIRSASPLGDGRMQIKTMGVERLRVLRFFDDQSYPTCETEGFALPMTESVGNREAATIRGLIAQYVSILAPDTDMDLPDLVSLHPTKLLWLAADLLQIRNPRKQALLESPGALELFRNLEITFQREITLLSAISSQKQANDDGSSHSLN